MSENADSPKTPVNVHTEGWPVLHIYYRIDRALWSSLDDKEQEDGLEEFMAMIVAAEDEKDLQVVVQGVIGKADIGLIVVHPSLERVQRFTQEVIATTLGACFDTTYSFLSLSEVSEYQSSTGDQARKLIDDEGLVPGTAEFTEKLDAFTERMNHYAGARIYPQLPGPDKPVICFYPMSKQRGENHNWYALSLEERKRLMGAHAISGRRYAGRIQQLITTATGIDDWEWGVTLFADNLKSVRDIVYELRYDEGSTLYGLFGEFYVGVRIAPLDIPQALHL
ncbi:MAG: chlorite dismutase family protein [Deltaproteobacteria bacterium]